MKNRSISIEKLCEILFFVSLFIYLCSSFIFCSFYSAYFSNLFYKISIVISCALLVIIEILHKKIKVKELILLLLTLVLTIIITVRLNGYFTVPLLLFVYSARQFDFRKIAKFYSIVSIVALFVIILSAKLSIIPNYVSVINDKRREFLGFRYALYPQVMAFNITCLLSYLNYYKATLKKIVLSLIFLVGNIYIYVYTSSRLSLFLSIIVLIVFVLYNNRNSKIFENKIISFLIKNCFIIFAVFSLVFTLNYSVNNDFYYKLDTKLEHRLLLGNNAIKEYGIKIFGNDVILVGNGVDKYGVKTDGQYNYIDSLYVSVLIKYGVLLSITILLLITYSLHKLSDKKDYFLLFIFFVFSLHAIIDDLGFYLYYNAFWLAIMSNISVDSSNYVKLKKTNKNK